MIDFNHRPVLVTGATGGIGGETVRQLMTAGADVIASGQSEEGLSTLAAETGVQTLAFDVTSEDSVRDALERLDLYGVVNCAGFGGEIATPMDTDIGVFDKVIAINTRGALLVTKYAARSMIRLAWGGSIVNVSSQASLVALPGHISYGASKAALDSITRVSALELGKYNIRVNAVNPTVVMTPMSAWYWGREDIGGPFLEQMPLGRWATEAEIAAPIVFLLSDAASMITGVSLPIDGGYSSRWHEVQAKFVEEPKDAVREADGLVAEVIQELATSFADQRQRLEGKWDSGTDVSTEDLRQALIQYRSFFQRLLAA